MNVAIKIWFTWALMFLPMVLVFAVITDEYGNSEHPKLQNAIFFLTIVPIAIWILGLLGYFLWLIWK